MAETLLDQTTGKPFTQRGDESLGAANVKIVGGSFDTTGLATEGSLQTVLADLTQVITQLVTIATAASDTSPVVVKGGAAIDAPLALPPFPAAGRAYDSTPPAVSADGNVVAAWMDRKGRQIVSLGAPRASRASAQTAITNSTGVATLLAAGAAGVYRDLTAVIFTNTDASSGTEVQVYDADGTTLRLSMYVPAKETRGVVLPGAALKGAAAASAWKFATMSLVPSAVRATVCYNEEQ